MINKARYEELEDDLESANKGKYVPNLVCVIVGKIQERIQTDWENNKEQLKFLKFNFEKEFGYDIIKSKIRDLEEDKKFLQELANKYGVELRTQ